MKEEANCSELSFDLHVRSTHIHASVHETNWCDFFKYGSTLTPSSLHFLRGGLFLCSPSGLDLRLFPSSPPFEREDYRSVQLRVCFVFLVKIYHVFTRVCVPACLALHRTHVCAHQGQKAGVSSPGARVPGSCKPPDGGAGNHCKSRGCFEPPTEPSLQCPRQ